MSEWMDRQIALGCRLCPSCGMMFAPSPREVTCEGYVDDDGKDMRHATVTLPASPAPALEKFRREMET